MIGVKLILYTIQAYIDIIKKNININLDNIKENLYNINIKD